MKNVVILFGYKEWTSPAWKKENDGYKICYEYLYTLAKENGIRLYRASTDWYDKKNARFLYAWTYDDGMWKRAYNVTPDLIYDKTSASKNPYSFIKKIQKKHRVLNDISFTKLVDNKLTTSKVFKKYSKKTYTAYTPFGLRRVLKKIDTKQIVFKSSKGSGGKDVIIIEKDKIHTADLSFPILVQEFIDSSDGIDGITTKIHDLRLVFIDNELVYSYIRTPAKGKLRANLALGGSMKMVPIDELPKDIEDIVSYVKSKITRFKNKIYTIDIMFDKEQKPWIIELNSKPGLFFKVSQRKRQRRTYQALIDLFNKVMTT